MNANGGSNRAAVFHAPFLTRRIGFLRQRVVPAESPGRCTKRVVILLASAAKSRSFTSVRRDNFGWTGNGPCGAPSVGWLLRLDPSWTPRRGHGTVFAVNGVLAAVSPMVGGDFRNWILPLFWREKSVIVGGVCGHQGWRIGVSADPVGDRCGSRSGIRRSQGGTCSRAEGVAAARRIMANNGART